MRHFRAFAFKSDHPPHADAVAKQARGTWARREGMVAGVCVWGPNKAACSRGCLRHCFSSPGRGDGKVGEWSGGD